MGGEGLVYQGVETGKSMKLKPNLLFLKESQKPNQPGHGHERGAGAGQVSKSLNLPLEQGLVAEQGLGSRKPQNLCQRLSLSLFWAQLLRPKAKMNLFLDHPPGHSHGLSLF